jgi:transposase InsO family protein
LKIVSFSRYKAEMLEGGVFEDMSQARSETFSYIEGYYNRVRRHSALGYKSPAEYEVRHAAAPTLPQAVVSPTSQ